MSTGDRFYRLLRAYVNHEWDRIRGIVDEAYSRSAAEAELNEALNRGQTSPATSQPTTPSSTPCPSAKGAEDPLDVHFKVLGLPVGSDFALVRHAYERLSHRSDPSRFAEGSEEAVRAEEVHKRVENAYHALRRALDPSAARFSDLET
ncbi:MAG: hypothetical protein HRF45_13850 [Fimbriimonadia bacterium]|jgi:hypothetical protein